MPWWYLITVSVTSVLVSWVSAVTWNPSAGGGCHGVLQAVLRRPVAHRDRTLCAEIFGALAGFSVAPVTGMSLTKSWKIVLSSGWVHSRLAVSVGTTSDRG